MPKCLWSNLRYSVAALAIRVSQRVKEPSSNSNREFQVLRLSPAIAVALWLFTLPAFAAEHVVNMVNKDSNGVRMQFEPAFLTIAPGDSVVFKSIKKGHNVVSIKGMIPVGVKAFKSKLSKDFTMTFTAEGVYGIKCQPHVAMGMVGLIQVGDNPSNVEAARSVKHRGKSKKRFDKLFARLRD